MKMQIRGSARTILKVLGIALCYATPAVAQLPIPPSSQFDITGLLQEATADNVADPLAGGKLIVNGHVVTVPRNTIVILPANALTWTELFTLAPAPYTGLATGMALADLPAPLTTYEVHVVGNRVLADANHLTDSYIAGLIYVSQNGLNSGAGFINFIDYNLGEMRVGGILGSATTGARVRINDPIVAGTASGRYSKGLSPDKRFMVDQDNPTIASATGFPMCLPRTDPAVADDPLCPQGNRLLDTAGNFVTLITMPDPATLAPGQLPDPRIQAPFEVGDYITFAGNLVTDLLVPGPTVGPYSPPTGLGTAGTYIAAHTIVNNAAIYTFPGTNPVYISTEVTIIGTGGLTVLGAGEAVIRTRFEGMTTDPSRLVHLYGMDLDPATGAVTDRDWGMIGVDPGAPLGAVKGRWRFRPPCDPTLVLPTDKKCTPPPAGTFLPPTREMRSVVVDAATGLVAANAGFTGTAANGLIWGQYHAPILEYIFPENVPGTPIVENNFNTIDFLARGGYTSSQGTLAGVLSPWPSNILPTGACTAATANAGGPYTVASGGSVALAGSATGSTPVTFAWSTPAVGALSNPAIANPVFTAPLVAVQTVVPLTLTVTNCGGSATASTSVTINAAAAPTVNHIAPLSVVSGTPVSLTATGTDPAGLALTFVWTQTGTPVVLNPNPFPGATISFTLTLPLGTTTSTVLQFSVVATNSAGVSSAPEFTTVTVSPAPDTVTITSAEYRISKQRLIINATSSVISPNVVLRLAPYVTTLGVTFDPCASIGCTLTNNGGGLYLIDVVGAPEPAVPPATPLVVTSSLGGSSPPTALQRIRQ